MDLVFIVTIIFIFLSVLIGTYIKTKSLDKCLSSFNKFHVTMEETDGDVIWGKLKVYGTGFILNFDPPVINNDKMPVSNYILYENQYSSIHALYRFHDELTEENKKLRKKIIKKVYSTAFLIRFVRRLRGVINTFKDAIIKSVGLIMGQMQKVNPGSVILKSQQSNITTMSSDIVGYAGNSFDPILEDLIGKKVILDIQKNKKKIAIRGLFMEYTDKFFVLNDINNELSYNIPLLAKPIKLISKYFKIVQDDKNNFTAVNTGEIPFVIEKITGKGIPEGKTE